MSHKDRSRCGHALYWLTCDDYDALRALAEDRCQICGRLERYSPGGLHIDHDHDLGWSAVRGLLCVSCNTSLPRGFLAGPEVDLYLAQPWHATRAEPDVDAMEKLLIQARSAASESKRRQLKEWRKDQQEVAEIEDALLRLKSMSPEQREAERAKRRKVS